jgi:alkylation response protein AidB-like acyl-CoA dehydrogenase
MIDFEPSEEQRMMRDTVAQFAKASLADRVRKIEAAREVPEDIRKSAHEMCLSGVALPAAVGGQELGLVTAVLLEEELGRVDAGAASALPGPGGLGRAVVELASEKEAGELLAPFFEPDAHTRYGAVAWSESKPHLDRPGFTTTADADGDGWVITGEKSHVMAGGLADRFLVFAQQDPSAGWEGIGAYLVMADDDGVKVGPRATTLGLDAVWFGGVSFERAKGRRVGVAPGADFVKATLRYFAKQALLVGARAVGLAHGAFELAREYCDTRVAFGKPIGHFQAVAFNLADRLMDVESARWMLWRAAWSWDSGKDERECMLRTAQASAHALEIAMVCADDCVSLHGGMGFIRDAIAEKLMRDAKQLGLCCQTSEQLDQVATAMELGADVDPGLLLPTPDAQSIFT